MDLKRREFLTATAAAAATLSAGGPLLGNAVAPLGAGPAAPVSSLPNDAASDGSAAPEAPPGVAKGEAAYGAPTEIKKIDIINLRELEGEAQKIIPTGGFGYISSAAGDEWTKRENEAAFKRITILPRYLTGYTGADTSTTLLGAHISMPIITSVMGGHGMAHVSAETGTAKGTNAAGTIFTSPSQSNYTLEEIAQAGSGPKWFQIYFQQDEGLNREFLQRAKAAGYLAVVVTIDAFIPSNRETDRRNHFRFQVPRGNYYENGKYEPSHFKTDLNWDDVAFVQKVSGLPVIVKGVLTPEMAMAALDHGCAGIQVSNHGGRQLDDVPATITQLPSIAEAVNGRMAIVMDGGVRRGQDVFKALANGANAVALGRPVLYGLALGGWMGVQGVLEHLNGEFEMTMRLGGVKSIGEISRNHLKT